jgi:hypothetical protein
LRNFYNDTKKSPKEAQAFLATYDYRDVVLAELNGKSTGIWTVSPPSLERLKDDLRGGLSGVFSPTATLKILFFREMWCN